MRDRLLLVFAAVAGATDGASYLGLGQVFTANMTGNTVLLGLAAAQGHWAAAGRSALALGGFSIGVAVGGMAGRRGTTPRAALAVHACVLAALFAGWGAMAVRPALVAGAAASMGLQSAVVLRADSEGVATTYLTGTLTKLVLRLLDRLREGETPVGNRSTVLPTAVIVVYGVAAFGIAVLLTGLGHWGLLVPLAGVLAVVARTT